jgi:DNA invertase Pin-like site-specific DNA recombinase
MGKMTEEDIQEAIAKYNSGMTLKAIADCYGVKKQYIDQIFSKQKIPRRPKKKVTPEMEIQIKALAIAGKTYTEISDATGVSRSTVCVVCKDLGIKRQNKGYVCSKCGGTEYRMNGKGKVCKICSATRMREYYRMHRKETYAKKDERND